MHSTAKNKKVTPSQMRRHSRGKNAATQVKISAHMVVKSHGGKAEAGAVPVPSKR